MCMNKNRPNKTVRNAQNNSSVPSTAHTHTPRKRKIFTATRRCKICTTNESNINAIETKVMGWARKMFCMTLCGLHIFAAKMKWKKQKNTDIIINDNEIYFLDSCFNFWLESSVEYLAFGGSGGRASISFNRNQVEQCFCWIEVSSSADVFVSKIETQRLWWVCVSWPNHK